ncbi:MAG: 6-phosphogluconolactonase [Verrucomicrobiota bacterium]
MENVEHNRFETADALAQEVARRWLSELEPNQESSAALSGGRVAVNFFDAVAQQAGDALRLVDFFWADDRCVPASDPDSNYQVANDRLFEPLNLDPARVHRIEGELDPPTAAERAEAEIVRVCGESPVLDWVFLGMGEDGHVASLFPEESEADRQSPRIFRNVVASKPPPNRVTLGYSTIAAAKNVWVLASGAGKAQMLEDSLNLRVDTPLARVLKARQSTVIFSAVS